jgi:hypothetical protein
LRLKQAILEDYSYRDLRGVDWRWRFSKFGPRLRASRTSAEFAQRAAMLLGVARDLHLWLKVNGLTIATFRRGVRPNVALQWLPGLVPGWTQHNPVVASGRFPEGAQYLSLRAWPGGNPGLLRPALRVLRQAAVAGDSLIIDVRANCGGAEPLAGRFAGCFIRRPVCYAKHLTRARGRFKGPCERWLRPARSGPFYAGRVAVLTGPGTVSSCESFVLMMKQVPNCTTIGQRTAGASGNPKPIDLGNGVAVFVPSWQDMDLDGTRLEGRGVFPQIEVGPGSRFSPYSDPVLDEALKVLRRGRPRRAAVAKPAAGKRLPRNVEASRKGAADIGPPRRHSRASGACVLPNRGRPKRPRAPKPHHERETSNLPQLRRPDPA